MPNIPTPFVGGADSPNLDRSTRREFAPPFAPGIEEDAALERDSSLVETASSAVEDTALEAEAAAATSSAEEAAPEPAPEGEVAVEEIDAGKAIEAELELPDYLLGPDAADADRSADSGHERAVGSVAEAVRLEPAATLEAKAQQLLGGECGDWIHTLVSDLQGRELEDAIAQAFAAGYLARVREEG